MDIGNKFDKIIEKYKQEKENKLGASPNEHPIKTLVLQYFLQKQRDKGTELIVEYIEKNNKLYAIRNDAKDEIWIYKEGIYVPQGLSYVKQICREILEEAYSTYIFNIVKDKIISDCFVEAETFFNTHYLNEIVVKNGILNIKTRTLTPFTSKKIFFQKLPIVFNPDKKCKNIIEFLKNVLENEEDIKVFQELFGYLLYKDYQIEKSFMFFGKGRNGKGITSELIKRFLGVENISSVSLPRLCSEETFSIAELHTKLANIGGDVSDFYIEQSGLFKSLSGNDTISAKRKFQTDLKFKNYAKMIFSCNKLASTKDTSDGFWDRWILIKFPYRFEHQEIIDKLPDEDKVNVKVRDNDVINKITTEDELSGLLNWSLDGLKNILKQQHFTLTKSTEHVKERWIKESNSFAAFCGEYLVENFGSKISKNELKKTYHQYCQHNKLESIGERALKNYLYKNMGVIEDRWRSNDEDITYWKNIKFDMDDTDDMGFSTYREFKKSPKGVNTRVNHDKHVNSSVLIPFFEFINTPRKMDEIVEFLNKKGLDILEIEELIFNLKKKGDLYEIKSGVYKGAN